jgi:hypothetical protein
MQFFVVDYSSPVLRALRVYERLENVSGPAWQGPHPQRET